MAGGIQVTVFAVKKEDLPLDFHALLGNRHLKETFVSLDFAQHHPDGSLGETIALGRSLASRISPFEAPALQS